MSKDIKNHPITKLLDIIRRDIDTLDNDPRVQLRIHTFGFWYWSINFLIITYLFFFQPTLWLKYGLFITLIYSIYANWTSDYTGMSSAQSVINTGGDPVKLKSEPFGNGLEIEK